MRDGHGICNRRASHVATVTDVIVGPTAMHGATIVPNEQVMQLPVMYVDILPLGREVRQPGQQRAPLFDGQADDMRGVRCEIKRPAHGTWVQAHDWTRHGWIGAAFLIAEVRETNQLT